MTPLIRAVALAVLPISFLISFVYLLGAEDAPGDGFTAGIISSLGLTLAYLSFGFREARHRYERIRFETVLLIGLTVTLVAAVLPMFAGGPLLAERHLEVWLPVFGELSLSRGLLFDVGIYLVVLGGTMTVIDALEGAIE